MQRLCVIFEKMSLKIKLIIMEKKISLKNSKLSLNKEKIAKISTDEMRSLAGGSTCHQLTCNWCGSGDSTGSSTRHDLTCGWCTTVGPYYG